MRSAEQPRSGFGTGSQLGTRALLMSSLHFFNAGPVNGSCKSSSAPDNSLERRTFPELCERLGEVDRLDKLVTGESQFCVVNVEETSDCDEPEEVERASEP